MDLTNRHIVVGVTGGIAAYKAVEVIRRLKKAGADVHVVMTREAQEFVTELTFREISCNAVSTDMFGKVANYNVEHISLARMADLMLVVPATANIMAKAANGIADDMLSTVLLATTAPVFFAPAMNSGMYENPATQNNMAILRQHGHHIIEPACGDLACGVSGPGRLPEPVEIVKAIMDFLQPEQPLQGKKVLVTAGGTQEAIDPVRYIGNRSSGKMGYAIAERAAQLGAEVVLVSGPTALPDVNGVKMIRISTASQMREACLAEYTDTDIVIKAAAVADYRVKNVSPVKIKKNDNELTLVLEKNPDILQELGALKQPGQILVGFAAETNNLMEYAKNKIAKKNLDMIVANDVSQPGAGFNTETNIIKIINRDGSYEDFPLMSKKELAGIILEHVIKKM